MFCENCGNKHLEGAKFCGDCGAKTEIVQPASTPSVTPSAYTPPVKAAPSHQQGYAPQQTPAYSRQPGSEPLRVGQYIGMFLLMCVPILSIILLFIWSFSSSVNLNKKNFARAMLILGAVAIILSIIFGSFLTSIIGEMFSGTGGYY